MPEQGDRPQVEEFIDTEMSGDGIQILKRRLRRSKPVFFQISQKGFLGDILGQFSVMQFEVTVAVNFFVLILYQCAFPCGMAARVVHGHVTNSL